MPSIVLRKNESWLGTVLFLKLSGIKHPNRQGHLAFRRFTRVSEVCSVRRYAALEDTTRKRNERDPNRCAIPSLCAFRPAPSRLNLRSVPIRVVRQAGRTATRSEER